MNCILFSSILLLSLIGNIYGRSVTFSLIAFGNEVTVTYNGQSIPMQPIDDYSRVHQAYCNNCPDEEFEYVYTVDGNPEPFTRKLAAGEKTTHNEFYGRELTVSPLKGLGYPSDKPQWTRSIGKTPVFDDSYIPTVIIDDGSRDYFITGNDTYTIGRFTIVLKNDIFTETNVPSKAQNRYEDKFQWRIKLENKLYKRKVFKFRANPNDPVFIRQQLYGDVIHAIGNPVHNQIVVRCYMYDGTPIGLYLMIEVTNSNSFIKSQFYGNPETHKINVPTQGLGAPLDCHMGSDFTVGGPFEKFMAQEGQTNEKIAYLTDALHALDVNDEAAVKKFSNEWLDLDILFKFLAMEYLTGHWDSYWMYLTNYIMYDDPSESTESTFKYYFLDQDFDLTFGLNLSSNVNPYGVDFPLQSYKTLVDRTWNVNEYVKENRELIDIFLKGGYTTQMFENHLVDIVKHVFNPVALGRRIDELDRRYRSEIEWDYSQERLHIATDPVKTRYVWTFNDYVENLDETPKISTKWGLRQYISMRAQAVANEFGFEWDAVPLEPQYEEIYNTKEDYKDTKSGSKESSSAYRNSTLSIILISLISLLLVGYNNY
jgi:hypothetical protein